MVVVVLAAARTLAWALPAAPLGLGFLWGLWDPQNRTVNDLPDGKLGMVAYMLTRNDQSEETWRTTLRHMRQMGVQVPEIG